MADQEFSSPGEHMAGLKGSSGSEKNVSIAYRNPNQPTTQTEAYINRGLEYDNTKGRWIHNVDDISDYIKGAKKYNEYYTKYNEDLFRQAMAYDERMSNTAIQRQMEDLKKAGINPILAGRLGGASYKGVNAPYVSINPASTLSAITDFYTNQERNQIEREKITSEEKIASDKIASELYKADLTSQTYLTIAKENNLTQKEIAELMEDYKITIQDMYDQTMKEINTNNIETEKELAKNENIIKIMNTGVNALKTLLYVSIFKNKFGGDKNGGNGNISRTAFDNASINYMQKHAGNIVGLGGGLSSILGLQYGLVPIF